MNLRRTTIKAASAFAIQQVQAGHRSEGTPRQDNKSSEKEAIGAASGDCFAVLNQAF
jgi:hypothetical protein